MRHCGTQIIETERLILRRFRTDDVRSMYKNWTSDPEVTKYLSWKNHKSIEESKMVLKRIVAAYQNNKFYRWAIILKGNGDKPIGSIGVVSTNEKVSSVQIGYCIGRQWWNMGIASESLNSVIDFMFDKVGVNRIEARHDIRNPHSGMVMKKCGMFFEGIARSSDINNQGICDMCQYAILKSDKRVKGEISHVRE